MWLHQLQHARQKNVIFVGILERVTDEFNRREFQLQMEGQKVSHARSAASSMSSS